MTYISIFKIRYEWYEGDHEEILLAKEVTKEQFEKDLTAAKDFAENLKGKENKEDSSLRRRYSIECLPDFYLQVIWFLTEKKGYKECQYDESEEYYIEDDSEKTIGIQKRTKKIEWKKINGG